MEKKNIKHPLFEARDRFFYKLNDGSIDEYKIFKKLNSNNMTCSICNKLLLDINSRNNYKGKHIVSINPCGHVFHKECILKLYENNKNNIHICPVCNDIYDDPIVLKNILGRNNFENSNNSNNWVINNTLSEHNNYVLSVDFSHDGKKFISGSRDWTIKIFDSLTEKCELILKENTDYVKSVKFSNNNKYIVVGSKDQTIRIFDLDKKKNNESIKILEGHTNDINSVTFNKDDTLILSGSSDKTVRLWNFFTGECIRKLEGHKKSVTSVIFNIDYTKIISCSEDWTIIIWDVLTGTAEKILNGHTDSVFSIVLSPDGKKIASGSADNSIKIWDLLDEGKCIKTLLGHDDSVKSVAFSPSGRRIASGSADKTIKIFNLITSECVKTLIGHKNVVESIAFSPNGDEIISGSFDKTIKIWKNNVQSGGKKKFKKLIDRFKKTVLVKIAKKNNISLKTRDNNLKTKVQLFNSLKRKKLI